MENSTLDWLWLKGSVQEQVSPSLSLFKEAAKDTLFYIELELELREWSVSKEKLFLDMHS